MAEIIAVIGTAGAVANIIDTLSSTISHLRDLHQQWKDADFALLGLVAQLGALRAALIKIKEWADSDFEDPYHQLRMDLDLSTTHCRALIARIDSKISDLESKQNGSLTATSRVKLIFGAGEIDRLQGMIDRQTNVLTLLLTVCNCQSITDQKVLVEKASTRKAMSRIGKDTASIMEVRDESSFLSRWSEGTSKLSMAFDFDRELFITRVYERALRVAYKDTLRRGRVDESSNSAVTQAATTSQKRPVIVVQPDPKATRRSQLLDRQLEEHSKALRRECNVLVLGDPYSGKNLLLRHIKMTSQDGYSAEERVSLRPSVFAQVVRSAQSLVDAMDAAGFESISEDCRGYYEFLKSYEWDGQCSPGPEFAAAIEALWREPPVMRAVESLNDMYLPDWTSYLFGDIRRICTDDYIPTDADVLRTEPQTTGSCEVKVRMGQFSIHLYTNELRTERKKWMHQFENVTSIMFVVDITSYDQVLDEENRLNKLMETLVLFDSVVNSRWFARTSIILLLNNASQFRRKLSTAPLIDYFPDYTGGDDVNRAAKYILWRFNQINRAHLSIYPHLTDFTDPGLTSLMFAAVKETIMNNALKDSGIFGKQEENHR